MARLRGRRYQVKGIVLNEAGSGREVSFQVIRREEDILSSEKTPWCLRLGWVSTEDVKMMSIVALATRYFNICVLAHELLKDHIFFISESLGPSTQYILLKCWLKTTPEQINQQAFPGGRNGVSKGSREAWCQQTRRVFASCCKQDLWTIQGHNDRYTLNQWSKQRATLRNHAPSLKVPLLPHFGH